MKKGVGLDRGMDPRIRISGTAPTCHGSPSLAVRLINDMVRIPKFFPLAIVNEAFCNRLARLSGVLVMVHGNASEWYYSRIVPCMEMGPRTTIIQRQRNIICVL
jgi:hypothetical protein